MGVSVEIIEPSMGDVSDRAYIRSPLRIMAIRSAAQARIKMSERRILSNGSHNRGIKENMAEAIIVAESIASGSTPYERVM